MIKSLSVWWEGALVGALRIDEYGDLAFTYDAEWVADPRKFAVSISLPKRAEPFSRRETRPFFAGLLPEGGQRDAVARALGVSAGAGLTAVLISLTVLQAPASAPGRRPRQAEDT